MKAGAVKLNREIAFHSIVRVRVSLNFFLNDLVIFKFFLVFNLIVLVITNPVPMFFTVLEIGDLP